MAVTKEEIRSARTADLFHFLLCVHPDEFKQEGSHWLRMRANPGICLKKGCGGYKNYVTEETGNSIDFLVRHLNYDFVEAVTSLISQSASFSLRDKAPVHEVVFPQRADNDFAIRRYLVGRGFPKDILTRLESEGLLYQDIYKNAVFRNAEGDFFEARGTWPGKVFHRCGKKTPDSFWAFVPASPPERAFICESAIDAVSLYLIHSQSRVEKTSCAYCGIAGVSNQKAIERIQNWLPAVLAVDNDPAGEQCRLRNGHLPAIIPQGKDWNEDLITYVR